MMRKGITDLVLCIIIGVVGIVAILVIIFVPDWDWSNTTDTKPVRRTTYTQQTPKQKTEGHCSILADKCIVDEWSPKCLWFDCIIDGRGKE